MKKKEMISIEKDLKGMSVLNSGSGEKLGEVEDAIVYPVEGQILGIVLDSGEKQRQAILTNDLFIGPDAVMVAPNFRFEALGHSESLTNGIAAHNLVGMNVVTEGGRLVGRVSEVYVSLRRPRIAYHIATSTIQRFLGGGFYLAGEVPTAYSQDGARIIVPEDTDERFAASSLEEISGRRGATA